MRHDYEETRLGNVFFCILLGFIFAIGIWCMSTGIVGALSTFYD